MVLAHNIIEKKRTKDIQILQNVTFDTMLLSTKTLEGLQNSGFYKPSPVQLHAIPMGKCGFDLLLEAKSGTGKTAVFVVIALEKIDLSMGLQAVIMSPTREIAAQICDVLKQIGSAYNGLRVEVVMGGLPVQDDIDKFSKNNVHIVVGSPGRLKHLIQDQHIDVSAVRLLVLDEADKLMEKSFLTDIKYINSNLPTQKQVIMSSATYPESSKEFLNLFVHGAQHICPENNSVLLGVSQKVSYVKYNSNIVKQTKIRFEELIKFLSNLPFKQCLIFCNYQVRVAELHRMLRKADWPVEMLHGQQDQTDRLGALKTLQEYKCRILISTDLASRGIDASNIDLVINFEPPFEWQTYLHRIGRAGRFGSYGTAITIASEGTEQKKFINLFKSLNSTVILSCLWNNNNENDNSSNNKEIVTINENESSECISKSKNTHLNDTINNYSSKTIHKNIESHQSVIKGAYDLLFTTCKSNVEIETLNDLMLSYEQYNLTDPKVNYEYNCINLPVLSIENTVCSSNINSCKDDSDSQELKGENTNNINSDFMSDVNIIDLPISSRKHLDLINNENYPNTDLIKLGLPTEFSSSKNKNLNLIYETTKTEIEEQNSKKERTKGKYDKTKGNNFSRNLETPLEKGFRNKNSIQNKTETINRRHKIKEEKMQLANNSANNSYCSSDINSYNNCYVKWYKQLKLRTKQMELALYINELSCI